MNIILLWDYIYSLKQDWTEYNTTAIITIFCGRRFKQSSSTRVVKYEKKKLLEMAVNLLIAKLFYLNFHPLEVVSRWRDSQLQVTENYSDLTKWRYFQILLIDVTFQILTLILLS